MRGVLVVGLLALLSACAGQDSNERYLAFCVSQGLEPGSDLFVHCLEQQRAKDAMEAERVRSLRELRPDR